MQVATRGGQLLQVRMMSGSLRCGRHLLLSLRSAEGVCFRLLLGPSNVDPATLAALGRRFRNPAVTSGTAGGPLR